MSLKAGRLGNLLDWSQGAVRADPPQKDVVVAGAIAVPGNVEVAGGIGRSVGHPGARAADLLGRGPTIAGQFAPHYVRFGIPMGDPDQVQVAGAVTHQLVEEVRPASVGQLARTAPAAAVENARDQVPGFSLTLRPDRPHAPR